MTNTTLPSAKLRLPQQAVKEDLKEEVKDKEAELIKDSIIDTSLMISTDNVQGPEQEGAAVSTGPSGIQYPTYQAGRLSQFFTSDGTKVVPVLGVYTADTEEKFNLLNYYVAQNSGLITPLF